MKAFYELYRDYEEKITISKRPDYSYPPHFHGSIEILVLLNGEYNIIIDNNSYVAKGKAAIISDSFCIHSFTKLSEGPSDSMLIIVPTSFLVEYEEFKRGQILSNTIITDNHIVDEIAMIAENMLKHNDNENIKKNYINVLLSLFISKVGLTSTPQQKSISIIKNVLLYIADNFKEDISLESISNYFRYSPSYLSRTFHSYFKLSISRYINNMRIQYIEVNKGNDNKLTTLIYDAGFKSPQTYYRNLKLYQSKS